MSSDLPLPIEKRNSREHENQKARLMADAERASYAAKMKGEKPRVFFAYGFSDIDVFTNEGLTWDLWIKFPFKVSKADCEKFKEKIQVAFEETFL